ncbi:TetR/AcrR family transcriptional regulator [Actinocrispum sp. NPDC049592]|uniref:TetR/AcrR family transcriptional regulator n=1 Tax=Actinocrispum sp. NPDC049592 TaxID=3154835 RepID=UPI0034290FAF
MTTEQRVRQAALELFAARGFHGTGIRDLAVSAGLSSATLYHYMGTKEDLLVAIMRESLTRLNRAAARIAETEDAQDRLAKLVALHVMTHAVQQLETRVVDNEMRALSPQPRKEILKLRDEYEAFWQQAIENGCAQRRFHTNAPGVARLALLEMCGGISRWYSPDGPLSLDDIVLHYIDMALGMLHAQPEPGQRVVNEVAGLIAEIWPQ